VPDGLSKALKMLEQRFGQPHVAKACVYSLVEGANISSSDRQGLLNLLTVQEPCTRLAIHERSLWNEHDKLAKMSRRLPVALQVKWRDED